MRVSSVYLPKSVSFLINHCGCTCYNSYHYNLNINNLSFLRLQQ